MRIDLSSDTATQPGRGMRAAMAAAVTGDEQKFEDATTARLNERVADLLGQEDALFLPSGTMCNLIAMAVMCRSGDEIIGARNAHIYGSEGAGFSTVCGASFAPIDAPDGIFGAEDLKNAVRRPRPRSPRSRVVVAEQTCNRGGGTVWPLETLREVARAAGKLKLSLHVDGARLLNAATAARTAASEFGGMADSIWIDFSKGLGCPIGAVLAGSRGFVEEAWGWKHRLGGAMRQSGVVTAACLYALDHNIERLHEDHANAVHLANGLAQLEQLAVSPRPPPTNIVMIDLDEGGPTAANVNNQLMKRGIRLNYEGEYRLRAVTHLGISRQDVMDAVEAIREILTQSSD